MADIIQIRRDLAASWTSANPTLAQGELGYETNTGKIKIGDGSTAWTSLGYFDPTPSTVLDSSDIGVTVQAYSSVLANTTASYTTAEETKLAGIETSADVTDTANVTAAGALMDSELTDLAGVKALNTSTLATLTGTETLTNKTIASPEVTGAITESVYTLTGTSAALDPANGTIQTHTLSGATTYTDSIASGESVTLVIPGTANTVTWPTVSWQGGSAPTLDTTNDNIVSLFKIGTTLYGSSLGVFS